MRFELVTHAGVEPVDVRPRMVLLAGYTGRDHAAVQAHVEELAQHGIAAPSRVPTVYAAPSTRLTTRPSIAVDGTSTSGEAEFILYRLDGRLLVGVGSDHTDRGLEAHSIVKAKQCCDKPVAVQLWDHAEIADHWDDLRLSAYVTTDAGEQLYQEGALGSMLTPQALLEQMRTRVGDLDDVLVFSGTMPIIGGEFLCGSRFRAELADPVLHRSLTCDYSVTVLPVLDT